MYVLYQFTEFQLNRKFAGLRVSELHHGVTSQAFTNVMEQYAASLFMPCCHVLHVMM